MLRIIRILKIDHQIINDWTSLWEEACNPSFYNSYEWFTFCLKNYLFGKYCIYACYRNDKLVGLFPTVRRKVFGVSALSCPGDKYIDSAPILLETYDSTVVAKLIEEMRSDGRLFLVEVDTKIAGIIKHILPKSLVSLISIVPYLSINKDVYRYESRRFKRKMKNRIRQNKKYLLHKHYRGKSELKKYLEVVISIDQMSSKKIKSINTFSNEKNIAFYKNLIEITPENIRIDILFYKDIPTSYVIGVVWNKSYLALNTAYLFEQRNLDPGKILHHLMLESMLKEGYEYFSFGMGHSNFKQSFTKIFDRRYNIYDASESVMIWWKLINKIRRLKQVVERSKYSRNSDYLFKTYSELEKRDGVFGFF